MASRNPLGRIKDLTKAAASVGLHVAGQATRTATSLTSGAVGKLVAARKPSPGAPSDTTSAPAPVAAASQPVNVTEELGLDPAPADQPKAADVPAAPQGTDQPLTTIDAAADPGHVDATPADIAKAVAKKTPARKAAATKAPAAKKSPAKKAAPGAKLPPRKKTAPAEAADQPR